MSHLSGGVVVLAGGAHDRRSSIWEERNASLVGRTLFRLEGDMLFCLSRVSCLASLCNPSRPHCPHSGHLVSGFCRGVYVYSLPVLSLRNLRPIPHTSGLCGMAQRFQ
jgi:hypothetical protein